ncbi:MAG: ATP-binding protein [Pirellulales bacterium]|nr:ATP-binding protein [Pirellulales bacterium]
MNELPHATTNGSALPDGLSLEKPARNLAALATTEALAQLRHVVLAQWQHEAEFRALARHGIRPVDRLLFYGPPGNGKTMASQWLAREIDAPLYRVRCETLVNKYLGETSANIDRLMRWLEKQPRCVVLFDEVETILPSRSFSESSIGREISSAMGVFWQYLDRWEAPTLFVLATNMPERLDSALLSRIDIQMVFGPPTPEQASSVIQYWAEVLHEYGGGEWGKLLDDGRAWESFRALFHAVQGHVRMFVTQ